MTARRTYTSPDAYDLPGYDERQEAAPSYYMPDYPECDVADEIAFWAGRRDASAWGGFDE